MFIFLAGIYGLTLLLCFSTYFFYPFALWVLSVLFPLKPLRREIPSRVSILISAYNEGKDIERKVLNTLELDFPREGLEILVGSDGSTDSTAAIVRNYAGSGVRLLDFETNCGKTAVQNDLVERSTGEILIFTDAASFLRPDAVMKLVRNFSDQRIGCVAGCLQFVDTDSNITTQSQGLYWRYESAIRKLESRLGSLIGLDGPLYAVRRKCYVPLFPNIISDLITPLLVLAGGYKVVWEPEAIVKELPTGKAEQEFATRRRIALRGLVALSAHFDLLNPLKNPLLATQILFHKLLRWFVGPLVLLNGLACFFLVGSRPFAWIFTAYLAFGIAAAAGWVLDRQGMKNRWLTVPYYFILVNLAATAGIVDFFRNKQAISWEPVR